MSSEAAATTPRVDQEVAAILAKERKDLLKKEGEVKELDRKVQRDEKQPPKNMDLVPGRLRDFTRVKAEVEGIKERIEALERGDFGLFPELQARKRKAPEVDDTESELTEPSDGGSDDGELEAGVKNRTRASGHRAKRRRDTDASRGDSTEQNEKLLAEDQRSATAHSEPKSLEESGPSQASGQSDVPTMKGQKSTSGEADLPQVNKVSAEGKKPAEREETVEGRGEGNRNSSESGQSKELKKGLSDKKGKGKEAAGPQDDDEEASGDDSDAESDTEGPYVYTAARQAKEAKAKLAITRYLETGGSVHMKYGLRSHVRERASHARCAGTTCYGLAFDSLYSRQKMFKCIYHRLVDKTTRKIDRPGQELRGVPYPPRTAKELKNMEGVIINGVKLPVTATGEAYCHCGCRLDDAVWGFFLWKSGQIEYNGDGHGYEVERKPPTPAQRNFKITRLMKLGFELEDMWSHVLVLGVYRLRPAMMLNGGGIPLELDFTGLFKEDGGLYKMDEPKTEEEEEEDR
ncbi:hypothetical protein V5O48_003807 [Marasmius crinis-equi]|uniref:Uncharacterized protein n=1 Tax=Marasmius crinis-equi TaxID=585013 RepID=A0ABR3FRU9_9AGAR